MFVPRKERDIGLDFAKNSVVPVVRGCDIGPVEVDFVIARDIGVKLVNKIDGGA